MDNLNKYILINVNNNTYLGIFIIMNNRLQMATKGNEHKTVSIPAASTFKTL